MAFINPEGLFEGERMRTLPMRSRLFFPWLIAASNDFGRLELTYESLRSKFSRWSDFPSEEEMTEILMEMRDAWLIYVYLHEGVIWGQFDISEKWLPDYKSKASKASPNPGPGFLEWRRAYVAQKTAKLKANPLLSFQHVPEKYEKVENTSEESPKFDAIPDELSCVGLGCDELGLSTHTALLENQEEPSEPPKPIPEPEPPKPDRTRDAVGDNLRFFPVSGTSAFQPQFVPQENPEEGVTFGDWFAKYVKLTGVPFSPKVEERSRGVWNDQTLIEHWAVWNDLKAIEEQLPWRQRFQRPDNYLRDQSWTEKSAFPRGKLPPRSEYRQRVEVELPSL